MDVRLEMKIKIEALKQEVSFDLLAVEPGNFSNFNKEIYWKQKDKDASLLKVTHVIKRAIGFKLLTLYKESDASSLILHIGHASKKKYHGKIIIQIVEKKNRLWKGDYSFEFSVRQFRENQRTKSGVSIDYAVLSILHDYGYSIHG